VTAAQYPAIVPRAAEQGVGPREEPMKYDDKIRSKVALAVCLRDMGNGTSRLFFDDVAADKDENPINWRHTYFYTFTPELKNSEIEEMNLTEDQFQQIGIAVVARLLALNGRVK
jgi:hypothetical protein